jgi:hypothetical protein
MEEQLPKGVYRAEDGTARYWDGSQWLEQESAKKFPSKKKLFLYVTAAVALLSVSLVVVAVLENEEKIRQERAQAALVEATEKAFNAKASMVSFFFKNAVRQCDYLGVKGLDYDQRRLTIDGKGEEDSSGASIYAVVCLLDQVRMPDAVESRWRSTNSLQGLVEGRWEVLDDDAEIQAAWSYHPDSGPQVALEITSVYLEKFDYEKHKDLVDVPSSS